MTPTRRPRAALLALGSLGLPLAIVWAAAPSSQKTPVAPGIQRERVNLVLIDVVVTDKKSRPVNDLRPGEFLLRVDGKPVNPQSVDLQWTGTAPPRPASPGTAAAGKAGEEASAPLTQAPRPRHFILFFDGLNGERGLGEPALRSARAFVEKGLPPGDQIMVVGLGGEMRIYQDFTSDAGRVTAALDAVKKDPGIRKGGGSRTFRNLEDLEDDARVAPLLAAEEKARIRRFLANPRALLAYLQPVEGRKELFLFSDGFPSNPDAFYGVRQPLGLEREILVLAREAATVQVALNPVNTQGLPPPFPKASRVEAAGTMSLATFAINSGGTLTHGVNDHFERALEKVEEETRASYVLSFTPAGDPDGKLHSTKVEVTRKGVQVRAQQGFIWLTEEQRQEREILSAYLCPELFRKIPVAFDSRFYLGEGRRPALDVALAIPDDAILLAPRGDRRVAQLDVGLVLKAKDGGVQDRYDWGVEVSLPREDRAHAGDLTLVARREVPPGDYEAVAVVRDRATGEIGAIRAAMRVPALTDRHLAMSTLVLSRVEAGDRWVQMDPSAGGSGSGVVPDVRRIFERGGEVVGSCQIYGPRRDAETGEARVRVKGTIRQGDRRVREFPTSLHVLTRDGGLEEISLEFPFSPADLDPGVYTLEVEALDEVAGGGVDQKVDFRVR